MSALGHSPTSERRRACVRFVPLRDIETYGWVQDVEHSTEVLSQRGARLRDIQQTNKKPRTGGAGLLGFHWGGTW